MLIPTTFKCLLFSKTVIDDNCFSFDGVMGWFNAIERRNDYVIANFYQIAIYTDKCAKITKMRDIWVSIFQCDICVDFCKSPRKL